MGHFMYIHKHTSWNYRIDSEQILLSNEDWQVLTLRYTVGQSLLSMMAWLKCWCVVCCSRVTWRLSWWNSPAAVDLLCHRLVLALLFHDSFTRWRYIHSSQLKCLIIIFIAFLFQRYISVEAVLIVAVGDVWVCYAVLVVCVCLLIAWARWHRHCWL